MDRDWITRTGIIIIGEVAKFREYNDYSSHLAYRSFAENYNELRDQLIFAQVELSQIQFREDITAKASELKAKLDVILAKAENCIEIIQGGGTNTAKSGLNHLKAAHSLMKELSHGYLRTAKAEVRSRF